MTGKSSTSRRGRIIGFRKDGLGARLLLLLNCIHVAETFNTTYKLYWPTDDGLAPNLHHPEHLFSQDYLETVFLTSDSYAEIKSRALPMWKFMSETNPDRIEKHLARGEDILVEEGFEVIAFPWENPEQFRGKYREYIKRIDFTSSIQTGRIQIDEMFLSEKKHSTAYHLRRGDILNVAPWKHTVWPSKIELDELYEIHIEKNPGSIALIFSDTNAAIEKFQSKYPHLKSLKELVNLDDYNAVQRDFLELYAMSRADQIIAPTISAFSMAAARIAGQQRVRFPDVFDVNDFEKAHKRTASRLKSGSESYLNPSDAAHAFFRVSTFMSRVENRADAIKILKRLKNEGADNAFLDVLQAANHAYLENWAFASGSARRAINHPDIWPDDFVAAKAIEALSYGRQKQTYKAGSTFREAYLYKPQNNTVLICGTHMSKTFILREPNFLPFDASLLRHAILAKNKDRGNSFIQNWIVNNNVPRRDFRFVTIDWHELVIDGKASRLPQNISELRAMEQRLLSSNPEKIPRTEAPYQSMFGLLQAMLGRHKQAVEALENALNEAPDRALYHKRFAVVLELKNDRDEAKKQYKQMLALEPDNAYFLHAWAMFLDRCGEKEARTEALKKAMILDENTAKISADYAMAAYRQKEYGAAADAMGNAIRINPVFGRFKNQLRRILDKS